MELAAIRDRCRVVRIPATALAARTGLHEVTVGRILRRGSANTRSVEALSAALLAEERALFDWLAGLHPDWLDAPARRAA